MRIRRVLGVLAAVWGLALVVGMGMGLVFLLCMLGQTHPILAGVFAITLFGIIMGMLPIDPEGY